MQNTYGLKILRVGQNADLLSQNYLKVGILPYTVLDQLTSKWAEAPILKSFTILSNSFQMLRRVHQKMLIYSLSNTADHFHFHPTLGLIS